MLVKSVLESALDALLSKGVFTSVSAPFEESIIFLERAARYENDRETGQRMMNDRCQGQIA